MLVFKRKIGEDIVLDGNIRVTLLSIEGKQARLGIDAPKDVVADRGEVHERRAAFALSDQPQETAA